MDRPTCLGLRTRDSARISQFHCGLVRAFGTRILLTTLRRSDTELAEFNRPLKTHLFRVAETVGHALVTVFLLRRNLLTYYTEWHTATSSREILRLSRSQVTRPVTNYGQNFS